MSRPSHCASPPFAARALRRRPDPVRCFLPAPGPIHVGPVRLGSGPAVALAELLPLLGCGEEAAALAFEGLARRDADPRIAAALRRVAAEEMAHDARIAGLAALLPSPRLAPEWLGAARRFHLSTGRGASLDHLARIAAIDAAICTILSRLLAPGRPLRADATVRRLLGGIHRDEAQHVRLTRKLAIERAAGAPIEDVALAARIDLADLLHRAGDCFEALAVDPDALVGAVATLPNGLLR